MWVGILEEASGRRHVGDASARRHLGGGIWEEASGRRHVGGGIWVEASGRILGEASGGLWDGSWRGSKEG